MQSFIDDIAAIYAGASLFIYSTVILCHATRQRGELDSSRFDDIFSAASRGGHARPALRLSLLLVEDGRFRRMLTIASYLIPGFSIIEPLI